VKTYTIRLQHSEPQ